MKEATTTHLRHPVEHNDEDEVKIGEAVKLFEEVDRQECEQCVFRGAYLIASTLRPSDVCYVIGQYNAVSDSWFVNLTPHIHHVTHSPSPALGRPNEAHCKQVRGCSSSTSESLDASDTPCSTAAFLVSNLFAQNIISNAHQLVPARAEWH